jgi:hypothetical protein
MILAWIVGLSFIASVVSLAVYWTVRPPHLPSPPDAEPVGEAAETAMLVALEFVIDL